MGWTVMLEDEGRKEISSLNNEFIFSLDLYKTKSGAFKLIKYLDPYGDTTFNYLQMDDLIWDLEKLSQLSKNNIIQDVTDLAIKCKAESHTYLSFYGD